MNTKKMFESHLKVADPVKPISGQGNKDDQQTETNEDSEPGLVLLCSVADSYFLNKAP